jgi:hypothetical protein
LIRGSYCYLLRTRWLAVLPIRASGSRISRLIGRRRGQSYTRGQSSTSKACKVLYQPAGAVVVVAAVRIRIRIRPVQV